MKTTINSGILFFGLLTLTFIFPATLSAVTLLNPAQGKTLASGSVYTISWSASPKEIYCEIEYAIGRPKVWRKIVDNYAADESRYDWTVVIPPENKPKCYLKITTYDFRGKKHSVDESGAFSIEVVKLQEPNGQYALKSGSKKTIRWRTNKPQQQVSSVQLLYSTNNGKLWEEIDTLDGNPELYFWSVPAISGKKKKAAVRVVLKDGDGNSVGSDQSDTCFQILGPAASRRTILYNAEILTMEDDKVLRGAICINGDTIEAIGSDKEILALKKKNTTLVNLNGLTILPGFIDPHTHLLNDAQWQGYSTDSVQWLALTNGVTGVGNIGDLPDQIKYYIEYAKQGNMRLKSYHYLCHTDYCGTPCGNWYENYLPEYEYAPNVWINGIKLFIERSVCPTIKPVFSDALLTNFTILGLTEWGGSMLYFNASQLSDVISKADRYGYQVAIHAIGDLGIETTIDAIDAALDGSDNINRHMIFHNHFITDHNLNRYADSGILAILEPARPGQAEYYADYTGEYNMRYFKRWKELSDSGAPLAGDSDWPYGTINPITRLDQFVTNYVPDYPGRMDSALSVYEALKLLTIRAAFAMRCEKRTGSLEPGKRADLVVLSDNPLETEPETLKDIQVLMTMVDGWVEYWSEKI